MKYLAILFVFFVLVNSHLAQIEIIPTNTTKNLVDSSVIKNNVVIS